MGSSPRTPEKEAQRRLREFEVSPYTLIVEKDGEILFTSREDRLAPLLRALETLGSHLKGARVVDRVVGRAAAWICVAGGVGEVITPLISEAAVELLDRYRIAWFARKRVPRILNQQGDGLCPMESLALQSDSAESFLEKLRARSKGP